MAIKLVNLAAMTLRIRELIEECTNDKASRKQEEICW
jgi:hypothetical protein